MRSTVGGMRGLASGLIRMWIRLRTGASNRSTSSSMSTKALAYHLAYASTPCRTRSRLSIPRQTPSAGSLWTG